MERRQYAVLAKIVLDAYEPLDDSPSSSPASENYQ